MISFKWQANGFHLHSKINVFRRKFNIYIWNHKIYLLTVMICEIDKLSKQLLTERLNKWITQDAIMFYHNIPAPTK